MAQIGSHFRPASERTNRKYGYHPRETGWPMSNEETKELAKHIEFRLKLGKFDALFLFVPSLLGIGFSLFQYYLGIVKEPTAMIAFMPILIVGIGMPVYIGYYRGGIKLDSMMERARGWIYIVSGVGTHIVVMAGTVVAVSIHTSFILLYLLPLLAIQGLVGIVALWVGRRVATLFDNKTSISDRLALLGTVFSSSSLSLALVLVFHPYRGLFNRTDLWEVTVDKTWDFPLIVAGSISGLGAWLWFERYARAPIPMKKTIWSYMLAASVPSSVPILSLLVSSVPQTFAPMFPQYAPILFISAIALAVSVPLFAYALLIYYYTWE
jgi:hypothetical protein